MENNRANQTNHDVRAAADAGLPTGKQPYHAPKLTYYGELVELVRANDGIGGDGGTVTTDCTKT